MARVSGEGKTENLRLSLLRNSTETLATQATSEGTSRELKQRQRRRQRERHKFEYLVGTNNSFARLARAFFTFVHFFAIVSKTTTLNSQIWGFKENVSTWR